VTFDSTVFSTNSATIICQQHVWGLEIMTFRRKKTFICESLNNSILKLSYQTRRFLSECLQGQNIGLFSLWWTTIQKESNMESSRKHCFSWIDGYFDYILNSKCKRIISSQHICFQSKCNFDMKLESCYSNQTQVRRVAKNTRMCWTHTAQ